MKKFVSLMIALVMVFSMATVAFAAEVKGSITVNGITKDTTYTIYKMLDLESYAISGAYSYKVNSEWEGFFATDEAKYYMSVGADGYATWNESVSNEDDAVVAAFAKLALAYAKENDIAAVASYSANADAASYAFNDLDLGYYLVDSTAGALCGLTTTDPNASINAKNHTPTVDKQVQEDLGGKWGDTNTADIGQIVNFMSIVHVVAGAENYVLHDKMSNGLTFEQDPDNNRGVTEIKHVNSQGNETTLELGTHYTVNDNPGDDCTFEISFTNEFIETAKPNDRLYTYYNAMLNRFAVAGPDAGNPNETWLEYGEDKYTTHDQTKTYTFSIDIVKTDSSNKLINGAKFRIYDAATGGNEIAVVLLKDSDDTTPILDAKGNPMYRRARADETGVEIEVKDGLVTIIGFDNGIYYLEETQQPDGYNKLSARKEFTISDSNLSATFNGDIYSTGSGVHVVNKSGSMLPETGGMGTVMFVTFGMFTVLAAGVLLVTKKRMSMIED